MTVAELIEKLEQVKDKAKVVKSQDGMGLSDEVYDIYETSVVWILV